MSLPHPLIRREEDNAPDICLIIDRRKSNLTKDDAIMKIKNDNIPISKVIKITKLKTDYRPFEAKRKLCESYDMFFADKRVIPFLSKLLGKQFFKKKKTQVPLDLKHKNWKEQIDRVCGSTLLYLKTGTCSVLKIGKASMGPEVVVENVLAAVDGIVEIVPRNLGNVRSFHLKLLESLALPVYQSMPNMRLKIDGVKEEDEEAVKVDLGEGKDNDVGGGSNKKKSKKGRIHEVKYMDSNIGELFDEDKLGIDSDSDIDGENDEGDEDSENDEVEFSGSKRKKGGKAKVDKSPKKKAKEMDKLKKEDGVEGRKDGKLTKKAKKDEGVSVEEKKPKKVALKSGGEDSSAEKEKKEGVLEKMKRPEMKVKEKKVKEKWMA